MNLQTKLDKILEEFDFEEHRNNDPVEFVWKYEDQVNQEISGLVASSLAYGRVKVFKRSIEEVLSVLNPNPRVTLLNSFEEVESGLEGFSYRMTKEEDMLDLLSGIQHILKEYASVEKAYSNMEGENHLEKASSLVNEIRKGRRREDVNRGLKFLLSDPADGSSCKRLNLFFRWMVRGPDQVDLGLWNQPDSSDLVLPLDTHLKKISRKLNLTERKSGGLKTAKEITENLKELDEKDPLKYDFALCHIGINDQEGILED
jgi:uncharacterized protein (TIGR02757 family)